MLALAPVAWLMARMYIAAGWWAVLAVRRAAIHRQARPIARFVEVREMFTETVSSLAEAVDKRDKCSPAATATGSRRLRMDIGRV